MPLPASPPAHLATLADLFEWRRAATPDTLASALLRDTLAVAEGLSHAELAQQVDRLAARVVASTRPGDRVLLVHPAGLAFVRAFWACVSTGRVAIPVPAPDSARLKNSAPRLLGIVQDAQARLVLTTEELCQPLEALLAAEHRALPVLAEPDGAEPPEPQALRQVIEQRQAVKASDIAYLQYTSGSTAAPRGAMLTHANVMAQCRTGAEGCDMDGHSRVLSWLPHHHDYGLVLGVLWPFFTGAEAYLMSPVTFLRRPLRWLDAVERFGITHSGAPNFAFVACLKAQAEQPAWQGALASLRVLNCGAEPIHADTMRRFEQVFGAHGLSALAIKPSYGMAETVLGITTTPANQAMRITHVDGQALAAGRVNRVAPDHADAHAVVDCGTAIAEMRVCAVDPQTREALGPTAVGELWVSGSSVGSGYWGQPETSEALFGAHLADGSGPWLRTGDLGFVLDGHVHVTGRLKDLIIVRGRNVYPQDLEWAAQSVDSALRQGYGAAFPVEGEQAEQVVLVQELDRREQQGDLAALARQVQAELIATHEVALSTLVFVRSGSLPRTSSGKIRRQSCRQQFIAGELQVIHRADLALETTGAAPLADDALDPWTARLEQATDDAERSKAVLGLLVQLAAAVQGKAVTDIDPARSAIDNGLDSLSAMRLLGRLEETLSVPLAPGVLLSAPDLATTAHRVAAGLNGTNTPARPPLQAVDPAAALPLSPAQQRMWVWQRLRPDTGLYNVPMALELRGELQLPALQAAWQQVLTRHAALRTRWLDTADGVRQRIDTAPAAPIRAVDTATLGGLDAAWTAQVPGLSQAPFDLTREAPVRAALFLGTDDRARLLIVVHHSVFDGQSALVLMDELKRVYAALAQGQAAPALPEARSFADHLDWEARWLAGGGHRAALAGWVERLRDAPLSLDLPTDRPRPPEQAFRGAHLPVRFDDARTQALRQAARREGVTLYMLLLAGWQLLLHRYSGQASVVTGSIMANRVQPGFQHTVGLFANRVALRTDLASGQAVGEWLGQVRERVAEAYDRQTLPYEQVLEALALPRDPSRMPLTQTFFVLQPASDGDPAMGPLQTERLPLVNEANGFDLHLELEEHAAHIDGHLVFDTALFDRETVQRLLDHWQRLLGGLCERAGEPVDRLPLLGADEWQRLTQDWNQTTRPYDLDTPLAHRIEAQVRRTPDALAVLQDGQALSYRELNRCANRLRAHLIDAGVKPGDPVVLFVERSPALMVGLLAIAKAGAAFVAIEADTPPARLAFMLEDTATPVVLTQGPLMARLPEAWRGPRIDIDAVADGEPGPADDLDLPVPGKADDLAYVVYTSGSTGRPKGVQISRRSLANHALWSIEACGLNAQDRFLQKTSIGFDAAISDYFIPLMVGATVVQALPGEHRDPVALVRLMREHAITVVVFVPSLLRQVLEVPGLAACTSLRQVMAGGEPLALDTVQRFSQLLPQAELGNFYGPSETTIDATHAVASGTGTGHAPIGRPIANNRCYVLDAHDQPLPVGVVGELCIGGTGVGLGYLNAPEATRERFVADPFNPAGGRMYRTGDRARWLPGGWLDFVGRTDHQVKVNGIRVELGDIEAALDACPGVRRSAVLLRDSAAPGEFKQLVAYVEADGLTPRQVKEHLRTRLAEPLIPGLIAVQASLPTLPNGKVHRQALPALAPARSAEAPVDPRTPEERLVRDTCCQLLGHAHCGMQDSFFDLGGHSLLAVRLVALLAQAGLHIDMRTVFDSPVLADLAAAARPAPLAQATAGGVPIGATRIDPASVPLAELGPADLARLAQAVPGGVANVEDVYRLSPLQEGLLIQHRLDGQRDAYLSQTVFAFATEAEAVRFVAALQHVASRHQACRTVFAWDGLPHPVQVVLREAPIEPRPVHAAAGEAALQALQNATDTAHRQLDLRTAPPLYLHLLHDEAEARWLLALQVHHLVIDQVGIDTVLTEMATWLEGRSEGLPPVVPYRAFVAAARQLAPARIEHHFRGVLGDLVEASIPFGITRIDEGAATYAARVLPGPLTDRLRAVARREGVTPAVLLHLAWALVVARTANTDDVVFGTVLAGRFDAGGLQARTVGALVNTLPLRLDLTALATRDALQRTRDALNGLLRHEQAPLALVQRCAAIPAGEPLFTSSLNYRHTGGAGAALSALPGRVVSRDERISYPVGLAIDDDGACLDLQARCDARIDAAALIDRMVTAIERLCDTLDRTPQATVLDIDVMPDSEWRRIAALLPPNAAPAPALPRVDARIADRARANAEATAVVSADRTLGYAALDVAADRLAAGLRQRGMARGARVGVSLDRGIDLAVAYLGVLRSGCVLVPLDPVMPDERLRQVVADAAVNLVLCDAPRLRPMQALLDGAAVAEPGAIGQATGTGDAADTPVTADRPLPTDTAYVLYTSGSSGTPKGVAVSHAALAHVLDWYVRQLALGPGQRMLHKTAIGFDPSLVELLCPLIAGATVVMLPPGDHQRSDAVVEALRSSDITHALMVPSQLRSLLEEPGFAACTRLRHLVVGGESLDAPLVQAVQARLPQLTLGNHYGPTETTIVATAHTLPPAFGDTEVPIGRPIDGATCLVLDRHGRPTPIGAEGELHIGGAGLSGGYLHLPEGSAKAFRPQAAAGGATMYASGDTVRLRPDGTLVYVGRADGQVKIRGMRVELGEIEARLRAQAGVRDALALVRDDPVRGPQLVAYVLGTNDTTALRQALARVLPGAMVPSAIVALDQWPRLPGGKVDRRQLPAPDPTRIASDPDADPPRAGIETVLAGLWSEVLGLERVGRRDHFFALGGHSLLATRMTARLRQQARVDVPLREVFDHPVLADLAARVQARIDTPAQAVAFPPLEVVDRTGPLPVSHSQRRMWLVQQLTPETTAYNTPIAVRLQGLLRVDLVPAVVDQIAQRHEAFRTRFELVDDEVMQCIGPHRPVPVETISFKHLAPDRAQAEARDWLGQRSRHLFDLANAPLHHAHLLCLNDQDHVLFWVMHHAIGDAWSSGVIAREFVAIYEALLAQREPTLRSSGYDYADYAAWQRHPAHEAALDDQMAFWRRQLDGLAPLTLPHDRQRRMAHDGRGGSVIRDVGRDRLDALRRFSALHGATPFMVLLACFDLLLGRLSSQTDVAVGTPIANRQHPDLEHMVGTFVNTLVMRTDLSGQPHFIELLDRVRHTALDAYAHQDVSFERVVEELAPGRQGHGAPLVQVMFNVINTPGAVTSFAGLTAVPFDFDRGASQFDLSLTIETEVFGKLVLDFAEDVFDRSTAERVADGFMRLVDQVLAAPDRPIGDYSVVPPGDEARLAAWNATDAAYDREATVHRAIAAQAARTPDAPAVLQPGVGELRHGELDARANRLAHALRARGIGRGQLVGLCVERGLDMLVAQLAILKAGAAYVPLDPAYPSDRLTYMAEDAGLALLVSESALVHALPWPREHTLLLDIDLAAIAAQPDTPLPADAARDARPHDGAYVIYTSGSTGKPKGVVVQHQAVVNFLASMAREPGLSASDTLLAVTTLSFDIAVLELLLPLTVGARIVLASRDDALDGGALAALIASHRVSVMQATPSSWRMLIEAGWGPTPGFKALIGGEGLPVDLAEQLLERCDALWNMYGPTETTVWSTCWRVQHPKAGIRIGRPIANTTIHILDERLQPCPIGVTGEICIGGEGVTLGYHQRPELTAERFIADPTRPGGRLYRTGDRGRWCHDGTLEHHGRMDFQVKVRGHRIELGEIESQLMGHASVARALVIVREDTPGDQRLVAYLVARPGQAVEAAALREHLKASLPEYMVPQHFVALDAIPLLPNGKVNRHALPRPQAEAVDSGERSGFQAPATETERTIAGIWSALLGTEHIGVHDNFFDLGGHSLLAMRAVTQINKALGTQITVRQLIFESLQQIARDNRSP